jgi:hypothetical protein
VRPRVRPGNRAEVRPGCVPPIPLNHAMRPRASRCVPGRVPCLRPVRPGCDFVTPDARIPDSGDHTMNASELPPVPATGPGGMMRASLPRIALTPAEAARSLGCSPEFFREHVDHELPWIRRGRKRFVAVKALERWAETNAERTL